MLQIAVCDDMQNELSQITAILKKIETIPFVVHEYTNPQKCLEDIENGSRFDCFLLDILMDEFNGIDIAAKIRQTHPDTPLLFITATPEFALDGYEVSATRYYLKPLDEPRFLQDLTKILGHALSKANDFITIHHASGLTRIYLKDIYYLESMLRTISIHTFDKTYSMVGKISKFEEDLKEFGFVRSHKSFLVNLRHIENIYKNTITLDNGDEVLLSKHRSKEIHELLIKYIQETI